MSKQFGYVPAPCIELAFEALLALIPTIAVHRGLYVNELIFPGMKSNNI